MFQVDGLGDLAPLAAAAPPGAPDLPEGDIIALGDEVGVIMIITVLMTSGAITGLDGSYPLIVAKAAATARGGGGDPRGRFGPLWRGLF